LAKVFEMFTREEIDITGMTVVSAGDIASIQFTAPRGTIPSAKLKSSGFDVLEDGVSSIQDELLGRKELRHLVKWLGHHRIPIYSLHRTHMGRTDRTVLTMEAAEEA
jgi:hypothetical protein